MEPMLSPIPEPTDNECDALERSAHYLHRAGATVATRLLSGNLAWLVAGNRCSGRRPRVRLSTRFVVDNAGVNPCSARPNIVR